MGSRGTATLTRLWLEIRLIGRGGNTKIQLSQKDLSSSKGFLLHVELPPTTFFSTEMLRSLGKQDIRRREFGRNVRGHLGARLGNGGIVVIVVLLVIDGKAGAELLTCRTPGVWTA